MADAFILMRYPFESPEAQLLNKQIFETIYYAGIVVFLKIQKIPYIHSSKKNLGNIEKMKY